VTESVDESAIWIETDQYGVIVDFSQAAVTLIGYSARTVRGRSLPLMFLKNRPTYLDLKHAWRGAPIEREGMLRPRNHRAVLVRYRVELITSPRDDGPLVLRWTLDPVPPR
jgi:PAS domain S-box-containing protein